MKKTLLILGIGAVVGAVTYAVWQSMKKQKPTIVVSSEKKDEDIPAAVPVSTPAQDVPIDDVDVARKVAESSITERHEEAAQIIKDAVEVICKQSASSDGELEGLDQIASGLDDLLKED